MRPFIQTIRYMGNKGRLLDDLVPEIEDLTKSGDLVCDIMAGTNAVGYALKSRNRIISNDVQYYSYVIANCLLSDYEIPTESEAKRELCGRFFENGEKKRYSFFADNYSDTYFSANQCKEIDSFRYAIEGVREPERRNFYLTLLMNAMCKAQSTTGHFAEYLTSESKRLASQRRLSVEQLFYAKIADFSDFVISGRNNLTFNLDYKELFGLDVMNEVKCFYLDPPYTADQYSRFYHILETVCLYDSPVLGHKGKYRAARSRSDFCYEKKAAGEFENVIAFCRSCKAPLVLSYSDRGILPIGAIEEIAGRYYDSVTVRKVEYAHSSQGKGKIDIHEVIFVMK